MNHEEISLKAVLIALLLAVATANTPIVVATPAAADCNYGCS